jgi:hypothetical protein
MPGTLSWWVQPPRLRPGQLHAPAGERLRRRLLPAGRPLLLPLPAELGAGAHARWPSCARAAGAVPQGVGSPSLWCHAM